MLLTLGRVDLMLNCKACELSPPQQGIELMEIISGVLNALEWLFINGETMELLCRSVWWKYGSILHSPISRSRYNGWPPVYLSNTRRSADNTNEIDLCIYIIMDIRPRNGDPSLLRQQDFSFFRLLVQYSLTSITNWTLVFTGSTLRKIVHIFCIWACKIDNFLQLSKTTKYISTLQCFTDSVSQLQGRPFGSIFNYPNQFNSFCLSLLIAVLDSNHLNRSKPKMQAKWKFSNKINYHTIELVSQIGTR